MPLFRIQVHNTLNGLAGVGGVNGEEAQVTGLRQLQGIFHGVFVTHLTHADYVGRLTHGALYRRAPAVGVEADFALGDDALDRAVDILDRVFDGYDVAGGVFVAPVEHRGLRSGFTGTGRAGQNNQAALAHGKLFEHLRQAQIVNGEDVGGDAAHDQADTALLVVGVHTETDAVL